MEMVTVNLLREGVNKHKARELAEHFYGLAPTQPALVQSCYCPNCEAMGKELAALKAQPAPVQEPVESPDDWSDWKVTPPAAQRQWVGLTEQEAAECWSTSTVRTWQAIEAKLKEKNNGY
jgi:hypothetical protein